MRKVDATGGKMKGRKEVRVDVSKVKSITGTMTGRKETGKKGTTEKAAGGKVSKHGVANRKNGQDIKQRGRRGCLSSGG